jgi:hypothetical protein
MTQKNKTLLPVFTILLIVGGLCGCGVYREQSIASNEASAVIGLQMILDRERLRFSQTKKYVPFDQLLSGDHKISTSQLNPGYRFEVRVKEDCKSFDAFASPAKHNETGRRSFHMNERGEIHAADKGGAEATPTDPALR